MHVSLSASDFLCVFLQSGVDVENAVEVAIDAGYRHIDCAYIYMNETEVGRALQQAFHKGLKRDEIFITTKVTMVTWMLLFFFNCRLVKWFLICTCLFDSPVYLWRNTRKRFAGGQGWVRESLTWPYQSLPANLELRGGGRTLTASTEISCMAWRGLCALRHGIQNLMEAILACHPALSTEWLDWAASSCELWRNLREPISRTANLWSAYNITYG